MMFAANSILFVPGSRSDRIAKALASDADLVCIDLEDSVAPEGKAAARAAAIDFIAGQDAPSGLWLRINPVRSATGLADILAVLDSAAAPTTLMLPKLSDPADLALLDEVMGDRPIRFVPLIETAAGLRNAAAIATAKRVHALLFGAVDLSVELGCTLDWEPLLHARAQRSASLVVQRTPVDLNLHPWVHWRWQIRAQPQQPDIAVAAREDAAARLVFFFDGDHTQLPWTDRVVLAAARR